MGDVESVSAKSSTALANIEAEDTAAVTLKFRNGAQGIIEATTATRPRFGRIAFNYGGGGVSSSAVSPLTSWRLGIFGSRRVGRYHF